MDKIFERLEAANKTTTTRSETDTPTAVTTFVVEFLREHRMPETAFMERRSWKVPVPAFKPTHDLLGFTGDRAYANEGTSLDSYLIRSLGGPITADPKKEQAFGMLVEPAKRLLASAGLTFVRSHVEVTHMLEHADRSKTRLKGDIDFLVKDAEGNLAVVDLKLQQTQKRYMKWALQTLVYSMFIAYYGLKQHDGLVPAYILNVVHEPQPFIQLIELSWPALLSYVVQSKLTAHPLFRCLANQSKDTIYVAEQNEFAEETKPFVVDLEWQNPAHRIVIFTTSLRIAVTYDAAAKPATRKDIDDLLIEHSVPIKSLIAKDDPVTVIDLGKTSHLNINGSRTVFVENLKTVRFYETKEREKPRPPPEELVVAKNHYYRQTLTNLRTQFRSLQKKYPDFTFYIQDIPTSSTEIFLAAIGELEVEKPTGWNEGDITDRVKEHITQGQIKLVKANPTIVCV